MNLKTLICVVLAIFANTSQADAGLAKSKNCFACHAVDKTVMGPSYKDVAAKYAGNKEAASLLAAKIRNGGEGVGDVFGDGDAVSVFDGEDHIQQIGGISTEIGEEGFTGDVGGVDAEVVKVIEQEGLQGGEVNHEG